MNPITHYGNKSVHEKEMLYNKFKQFSWVVICLTFLYSIFSISVGLYKNFIVNIFTYTLHFSLIYFITIKKFEVAKYLLVIGWPFLITIGCLIIGHETSFDLVFFICAIYTSQLLENQQGRIIVSALNVLLFMFVRVYFISIGEVEFNKSIFFYLMNPLVVFVFLFVFQELFLKMNAKNQQTILEKNAQLDLLNQALEEKVQGRTTILEERNKELQELYEHAKGYTYIVSHDLKEPVRSMVGFSQLMKRDITRKNYVNVLEYANYIERSSKRLHGLITDILSFYTLGKNEVKFKQVNINELVRDVLGDIQLMLEEHQAKVDYQDLPIITGNTAQLNMILSNLITNAIKFRRVEIPHIKITHTETTSHWHICIDDNGKGIPIEKQAEAFQMFKRLENNKGVSGSGLGLAICKKITNLHEGDIQVLPKGTAGTRIEFTISKDLNLG